MSTESNNPGPNPTTPLSSTEAANGAASELLPPSPISGHSLTKADAAKGLQNRWKKYREQQEELKKAAMDRILGLDNRAISVLEAALDSSDEALRIRAAVDLLDRAHGKAVQKTDQDIRARVTNETEKQLAYEKLRQIVADLPQSDE